MKILITSDNHLGYKENDPVRKDDSYITFDEICQTAINNKVDCILQVGDLFHDNRPSRYCINRTINILRKHIVDKNITASTYKVKLPFICIHGNHDDPSGINKISTLDILHSAGLVQYIGKNNIEYVQIENIRIYGIGYIKDKNINGIFTKMEYTDLSKDFFNILLVHQNRIPRNKDYLCPSVIPDLFNLMIYGHEHDPVIIRNKTTVLQCGSTIRTSLCEAESTDKYCYILEGFILKRVKLSSVRPFKFKDISLTEEKEIIEQINDTINEDTLINIYTDNNKRHKTDNNDLLDNNNISIRNMENNLIYPLSLPLIRIRILTTKVLNINKNKIFHIFKDKVANPSDIIKLIPHKKPKNIVKSVVYQSQNITDIIKNHLKITPLECIPEYKFIEYFSKESDFLEIIDENVIDISNRMEYGNCLIDDIESEIRKIKVDLCRNKDVSNDTIENQNMGIDEDSKIHENINTDEEEKIVAIENTAEVDIAISLEDYNIEFEIGQDNKTISKIDTKSYTDNDCKIITGKDSKTMRKNLNNHNLMKNINKEKKNINKQEIIPEDIISDFSKLSSNLFTSETNKDLSNSFIKIEDRKLFEEDDSSDLMIDF